MLRMFRIRRYRLFVAFALVFIILLVKFTTTIGGNRYSFGPADGLDLLSPPEGKPPPSKPTLPNAVKEQVEEASRPAIVQMNSPSSTKYVVQTTSSANAGLSAGKPKLTLVPTVPAIAIPDRKVRPGKVVEEEEIADEIHPIGPPGRQDFPSFGTDPTTIHWSKQTEHFPIPTESIIHLPTGAPVSIPKIQHIFNDETPDAKINREKRQVKVREEFKKAWEGYKKYAWLHDELVPKSGKFRDPFCGWAATLVDSLDTLWIMGLQEDFEEAARAVDMIDFTTTPRSDIPVFETTIRYLGGLLAAYDVSGGKYQNLLDKAVELAEVLMGAFDTPNRMPVLYYRWKPAYASQPHRASQRTNLAELGSLSMEFTRLAQLTKEPRYYDAVARITNALSEYQDRGTRLGSVFPDNIDASGCNRTVPHNIQEPIAKPSAGALTPTQIDQAPEGYKPDEPATVKERRPLKKPIGKEEKTLELEIVPDELSKAHIAGWDDNHESGKAKRELPEIEPSSLGTSTPLVTSADGLATDLAKAKSRIAESVGDWDCTPQGLDSASYFGFDHFSMGGGQDSTYEYFPKQYLLLAGREEKYKKLYLKTIEDVRKWMLYRPMVPDNRDILFSGAVTTSGNPEKDVILTAEVEHLTCFIGGMIGMGAKIFDLEGDLELAKKLADGCVWAYGATPMGIMPEGATVIPCESTEHCAWNETAYFHFLDPMADERDYLLKQYDENKLAMEAEALEQAKLNAVKAVLEPTTTDNETDGTLEGVNGQSLLGDDSLNTIETESKPTSEPISLQKRQRVRTKGVQGKRPSAQPKDAPPSESVLKALHQKAISTETELRNVASAGRQAEVPIADTIATPTSKEPLVDPLRPLSHKDFVEARIKQAALPPGFVGIRSRTYILRPEAIESVWYMYRITGDATWQDKGWTMFEAIINATSTRFGHSAIHDVTASLEDGSFQMDQMESFWLAETLKYFYLLYSTPDVISLDEWVLNTEAHPFKLER